MLSANFKPKRTAAASRGFLSRFSCSQSTFKMSIFHTSSMCFCEAQIRYCCLDPVAAGFILTASLSSVHRCSLAWDKIINVTLLVFKHNSPDVIVKRVNVWRVWSPFSFANKFTAVGGNPILSQLRSVSRRTVLLGNETRR